MEFNQLLESVFIENDITFADKIEHATQLRDECHFVFDIDGTIVDDKLDDASIPEVISIMLKMAEKGPISVLTGREKDSVRQLLDRFGIGNVEGIYSYPEADQLHKQKAAKLEELKSEKGCITFVDNDNSNLMAAALVPGVYTVKPSDLEDRLSRP